MARTDIVARKLIARKLIALNTIGLGTIALNTIALGTIALGLDTDEEAGHSVSFSLDGCGENRNVSFTLDGENRIISSRDKGR